MNSPALHINTIDSNKIDNVTDVVFLHGWGVNSAVFHPLQAALSEYRVHYVDLPGFGESEANENDIKAWSDVLAQALPENAIWLGWSLGGLVATQIAISHPQSVKALITVASSPCFMAQEHQQWPGIAPKVLAQFSEQLKVNLAKTIERFLAIQAMGSDTAKADILAIKRLVLARSLPSQIVLDQGLTMLRDVDLRPKLHKITQPWLRVWGKCDNLVPNKIVELLPQATSIQDVIHNKASHAPFISHPSEFLAELLPWMKKHSQ